MCLFSHGNGQFVYLVWLGIKKIVIEDTFWLVDLQIKNKHRRTAEIYEYNNAQFTFNITHSLHTVHAKTFLRCKVIEACRIKTTEKRLPYQSVPHHLHLNNRQHIPYPLCKCWRKSWEILSEDCRHHLSQQGVPVNHRTPAAHRGRRIPLLHSTDRGSDLISLSRFSFKRKEPDPTDLKSVIPRPAQYNRIRAESADWAGATSVCVCVCVCVRLNPLLFRKWSGKLQSVAEKEKKKRRQHKMFFCVLDHH